MTIDADLVAPAHTAVLTMEMQRGIVGDLAKVPTTAGAVATSGVAGPLAELLGAARRAGARVVHCTVSFRPDRAGTYRNVPMINRFLDADPDHLTVSTPQVEVLPELRDPEHDLESMRHHGMGPFTGTTLDPLLRALGTATIVATGVSLNRGVTAMTLEALGYGYHVVIPTDCVVGYPAEYAAAVLEHGLAPVAHLTTGAELAAAWKV
jgi:nicotinamidase-related amidase